MGDFPACGIEHNVRRMRALIRFGGYEGGFVLPSGDDQPAPISFKQQAIDNSLPLIVGVGSQKSKSVHIDINQRGICEDVESAVSLGREAKCVRDAPALDLSLPTHSRASES